MTHPQRSNFVQFVYAKSRLPNSPEDFLMRFKISPASPGGAQDDPDSHLPGAKTCFFEINLPRCVDVEIIEMREQMMEQNDVLMLAFI